MFRAFYFFVNFFMGMVHIQKVHIDPRVIQFYGSKMKIWSKIKNFHQKYFCFLIYNKERKKSNINYWCENGSKFVFWAFLDQFWINTIPFISTWGFAFAAWPRSSFRFLNTLIKNVLDKFGKTNKFVRLQFVTIKNA